MSVVRLFDQVNLVCPSFPPSLFVSPFVETRPPPSGSPFASTPPPARKSTRSAARVFVQERTMIRKNGNEHIPAVRGDQLALTSGPYRSADQIQNRALANRFIWTLPGFHAIPNGFWLCVGRGPRFHVRREIYDILARDKSGFINPGRYM